MAPSLAPDLTRELATVPRPLWAPWPGAERVNRHIARSEGFAESMSGAWDQGAYALFEEMEEKDPHLHSILQTRKNGLLARPRKIEPASSSARDQEVADWVRRTLPAIPGFEAALARLLDAIARGMAVAEIVWGYGERGRIIPTAIKPRSPGRFSLADDGALLLTESPAAGLNGAERLGQPGDANRPLLSLRSASGLGAGESARARRLPDRKFIRMLFGADDDRPYGRGLCERVYWLWWFKKNNLKFWAMYNEKFGAPTVVARHKAGLSQPERDRLLEVISSLQADAGVTVPEGITLELLESGRRGSAETYRDLANWCNEEMSRVALGQTLTVSEGSRSGSLALGQVHERVRFDYIRADAGLLVDAVNSQLVRWMVDFNFGTDTPAPRWIIDLTPDIDAEVEAQVDRLLLQMGVPLPLRHFYEKYERPQPAPGEQSLKYDDHNLFQYHLQFGVLTVNEVRASLGLPPVRWGDEPTSAAAAHRYPPTSGGPAGGAPPVYTPPASRAAAGDDLPEEEKTEADRERELERAREK